MFKIILYNTNFLFAKFINFLLDFINFNFIDLIGFTILCIIYKLALINHFIFL